MFGFKMFANHTDCRCFAGAGISMPVIVIADTAKDLVVSVFARRIAVT